MAGDSGDASGVITAKEIWLVDDDGNKRMLITSGESFALKDGQGTAVRAGILFYDNEGRECGGLSWSGRNVGGRWEGWGSLLFDDDIDQVLGLAHSESGDERAHGVFAWERPSGADRLFIGWNSTDGVTVALKDSQSRPRIRLRIDRHDNPLIEFLDESGDVVSALAPPENK